MPVINHTRGWQEPARDTVAYWPADLKCVYVRVASISGFQNPRIYAEKQGSMRERKRARERDRFDCQLISLAIRCYSDNSIFLTDWNSLHFRKNMNYCHLFLIFLERDYLLIIAANVIVCIIIHMYFNLHTYPFSKRFNCTVLSNFQTRYNPFIDTIHFRLQIIKYHERFI